MLRRERKTSHFGVVGEREEDEWKVGKCARKYKERVSDFQSLWKRLTIHMFFWYVKALKSFLVKFRRVRNQANN